MAGPLTGYRIIEVAGIGPGPFCAMMLADMGADVIRVDRAQNVRDQLPDTPSWDVLNRGRRSIGIDLKNPDGVETLLRLVEGADAIIEGFRPGVMERLGVGPDICLARNPKLVFGRMTGWGQDGPYSSWSGHDINYIALAGALAHFGRAGEAPAPPLNMVGDFGGGGMLLAFGVVCALLEASKSGQGQVIDAAMVDGAAVLMAMFHAFRHVGMFDEEHRGTNLLDSGAHFYDVYRCSDGKYISVGSIEPQFYAELLRLTGLKDDAEFAVQMDKSLWPVLKGRLEVLFHSKTRDEWCAIMEHTDVCFAPVLTMSEAIAHPHNQARSTFVEVDGITQPAPAPRFSRTDVAIQRPPAHPGQHTREVLADWGLPAADIDKLFETGAVKGAVKGAVQGAVQSAGEQALRMGTLVCFHAHPDDEPTTTGGTIARAAADGHRVVLVVATNGDHGEAPDDLEPGESLVERRRKETARSAELLGIARVVWLGYRDSGMTGWEQNAHPASFHQAPVEEAAGRLAAVLREERADVLVTYDWHGNYGHPDHIKVHVVGHRAAELAGTPEVYEATMNHDDFDRLIAAAKESGMDYGVDGDFETDDGVEFGMREDAITTAVDVRDWIEVKRAAIGAHASQVTDTEFFLSMPVDTFTSAFGTEWFIHCGEPGGIHENWLVGLTPPATTTATTPPPANR